MELVATVMICISFTMLLLLLLLSEPCVSQEVQKLPRKLKPLEETSAATVRGFAEPELKNNGGPDVSPGGEQYQRKHGSVHGTWREGDSPGYYSMDYAFHRRRRPIHNKSLPRQAMP